MAAADDDPLVRAGTMRDAASIHGSARYAEHRIRPFLREVIEDGSRQWIIPTGGAYLFAPGRAALAKFADPPSASLLWNARTFFAKRFDRIANLFTDVLRD